MSEDIQSRINFMTAIDALKEVQRKSYLMSGTRFENSAEHSWAVSTFALIMQDYAPNEVDIQNVIKMLLIHDIVEVDAGDTLLYDEQANASKKQREITAANKLFGILPERLAKELRSTWDEFEEEQTNDAKFAAALDRLIPLLHNIHTKGRAWKELAVRYEQIITKNQKIKNSSPELWSYIKDKIDFLFQGRETL